MWSPNDSEMGMVTNEPMRDISSKDMKRIPKTERRKLKIAKERDVKFEKGIMSLERNKEVRHGGVVPAWHRRLPDL